MRMDSEYRLIAAQELREPRTFYEAFGYWPIGGADGVDYEIARLSPCRRLLGRVLGCGALAVVLLLAMAGSSLAQPAKGDDSILFLQGNPTSSHAWRNAPD